MKVEIFQDNSRCKYEQLEYREAYSFNPDSGEVYCKINERLAVNLNTMNFLAPPPPHTHVTRVSKSVECIIEASTQSDFGQLARYSVFRTAGKIYKKVSQTEAVHLKSMFLVNFSADIKVTVVDIERVEVYLK